MGSRLSKIDLLDGLAGRLGRTRGGHRAAGADAIAAEFGSFVGAQFPELGSAVGGASPERKPSRRAKAEPVAATKPVAPGEREPQTSQSPTVKHCCSPPANAGVAPPQSHSPPERRMRSTDRADRKGQLNEIAGDVLDANTAREIPAHIDPATTATVALQVPGVDDPVTSAITLGYSPAPLPIVAGVPPGPATSTPVRSSNVEMPADDPTAKHPASVGAAFVPNGVPHADGDRVTPAETTASDASAGHTSAGAVTGDTSLRVSNTRSDAAQNANAGVAGPGLLGRMIGRAAAVDARLAAERDPDVDVAAAPHARATVRSVPPAKAPAAATMGANGSRGAGDSVLPSQPARGEPGGDGSAHDAARDGGFGEDARRVIAKSVSSNAPALDVATGTTAPSFVRLLPNAPSSPAGTLVDPSAVAAQVVKAIAMRSAPDGTSEVRLHLQPEQLGAVTLKLTVDGSSVSATAIAHTADAHGALIGQHQQLARSLAESGLKLTSFHVDLSGQDAGTDRGRDRATKFGWGTAVRHVAASAETPDSETFNGGPPLLPSSTLGLFSYFA